MRTLVLDAFSGISGDMFLGAMFSLGMDRAAFEEELSKLGVDGFSLSLESTQRSSITGMSFDVVLADHQVKDNGITEHAGHHGRSFATIRALIEQSALPERTRELAVALFSEVARAEGRVHHRPVDDVHFHEVGALDSIVDLVGAAIAVGLLGIDRVIVNDLTDGSGTIQIAHGIVPVPVPAVQEMRVGTAIPLRQRFDVHTELITPTGMAIVKCLADAFDTAPGNAVLVASGYGFGTRDTGSLNALRASLFDTALSDQEVSREADQVLLLETNLDDVTGQQVADAMAEVLRLGARDVWVQSILMKKGRPGQTLSILTDAGHRPEIVAYLFSQTPTIGVRAVEMGRDVMRRELQTVHSSGGDVRVKVLRYHDIVKFTLEHDDVLAVARRAGTSVEAVCQEVSAQFSPDESNADSSEKGTEQ